MTNVNLHAPEYKDAESKVMFFLFFYFVQGEGIRRCIQRQALSYVRRSIFYFAAQCQHQQEIRFA